MTDEEAWAEIVAAVHRWAEKNFTPEMEAKQAAMRKRNHERLVRLGISREDSPDE
jgi:hypothetical protein